jgi:hypothetical protein
MIHYGPPIMPDSRSPFRVSHGLPTAAAMVLARYNFISLFVRTKKRLQINIPYQPRKCSGESFVASGNGAFIFSIPDNDPNLIEVSLSLFAVNTTRKKKKDKDSVDFGPIKCEEHDTKYWENIRDGECSKFYSYIFEVVLTLKACKSRDEN